MHHLIAPALYGLAGLMVYAAFYHAAVSMYPPRDRMQILFSAMCLLMGLFALSMVPVLEATGASAYVRALKLSLAAVIVLLAILPWFISLYTGIRPLPLLLGLGLLAVAEFVVNLIQPYGLQYDRFDGIHIMYLPWGEGIAQGQGQHGPWLYAGITGIAIGFIYGIYALNLKYRRQRQYTDLAALIAVVLMMLSIGQGILVRLGVFHGIEFGLFGFIILALTMSISLGYGTQQRLRTSEHHFRSLFENSPTGMFSIEPTSGRILQANPVALSMTGYDAEEIRSKTLVDLSCPEDMEECRQRFEQLVNGESLRMQCEHHYLTKNGDHLIADHHMSTLRDVHGQIVRFIASITDITERKAAEEEREELRAQLIQAQKMDSIGRLAGGIAHDFNNMLSVIIIASELALDSDIGRTDLTKRLREILNAADCSADLTRQLLTFARKQTALPKTIGLNQAVESMLKMLQRMISEDVELEWRPGEDIWPVLADPSQLDQILANLCVNARDAIEGAGRISIETGNATLDAESCTRHPGAKPGDYVRLSISDNGNGMDEETLTMIFEPFFTTKEPGRGTGLGLSTVYGIVQQSNGFIDVHSEPGQGTTFGVYLPRQHDISGETSAEIQDMPLMRGDERILLVEDEATILSVTQSILETCGYTVLPAQSPEEAMRIAQAHHGDIHMLITDIIMPHMNGRELAEALQPTHPQMKCLYMSGYFGDVIIHHQGEIEEGFHFIQKPFTRAGLTAKVRQVLDGIC